MYTMAELARLRVFVPRKASRKDEKAGVEPEPKRLGRVHNLVFAPDGRTVVGLMVKRPDIAGMVKQDDRFLALDAVERTDAGLVVTRGEESFDTKACKRLGLDLDTCFIWSGMPVTCENGRPLGYVMDARFNEKTGAVDCFCAQEGQTASALVGSFEIPAAWLVRYERGRMVVRDAAASLELSGGLAGKAGEGYAAAKQSAKRTAAKMDDAASAAVDKGSHALGGMIGRAKRSLREMTADDEPVARAATSDQAASETAVGKTAAAGAKPAPRQASPGAGRANAAPTDPAQSGRRAAQAVTKQLGKTKGMFSGFMREFKDASK